MGTFTFCSKFQMYMETGRSRWGGGGGQLVKFDQTGRMWKQHIVIHKSASAIKCISVPRDDSSYQRNVIHNVCVETKCDYPNKQM
jgi:hypothetical protein